MGLKNRITIISEENMNRLTQLYGKLDLDDLELIVNNHLNICIDEIMEDENKSTEPGCIGCNFGKCYGNKSKRYFKHVEY